MAFPWELTWIPAGDAGIEATLHKMRALLRDALFDQRVVLFAQRLVLGQDARSADAQFVAVADFVRSRWFFTRDPYGGQDGVVELLKTPARLLSESEQFGKMQGDCDDASLLAATLLAALGFQTRFVVIQREPDSPSYDHIIIEGWTGQRWLAFDGVALGMGFFFRPPGIREAYFPI